MMCEIDKWKTCVFALGIEALLELFLRLVAQESDCRKPDPCGNAQIVLKKLIFDC